MTDNIKIVSLEGKEIKKTVEYEEKTWKIVGIE